jgi:hypothetical protein
MVEKENSFLVKGNIGKFNRDFLDSKLWNYIEEKEV